MSESDKITFYVGNGESDHVKINGKSQSFALRYDITSNSMDYYSAVYLLCAIIIGILIIVMYWYLFIANKKQSIQCFDCCYSYGIGLFCVHT